MNGAARRKEALAEVEGCVCRDRQSTHGDAEDNFADIAKMWSVYTGTTFKAQDVAAMKSGAKVFVVLRRKDIDKIRAFSRGAAQADSVWNTHDEAMWKKSAIRALCKIIPQSSELRDALSDDDEFECKVRDAVPVKAAVVDSAARAASDMLSAPTPSSEPDPIHEPDGMPSDPVPPAEPQLVTPQSELDDLVVKTCNSDFDKFIALCESQGWLKNNRATEFSELPDAFTKKMLASKAALQALLTAAE